MTQEQIDFVNTISTIYLNSFLTLKQVTFNNEWSNECERLFVETRNGIIHISENYLLQPVRTLNPHQLTFTPENTLIRLEIEGRITEIFTEWRNTIGV